MKFLEEPEGEEERREEAWTDKLRISTEGVNVNNEKRIERKKRRRRKPK